MVSIARDLVGQVPRVATFGGEGGEEGREEGGERGLR